MIDPNSAVASDITLARLTQQVKDLENKHTQLFHQMVTTRMSSTAACIRLSDHRNVDLKPKTRDFPIDVLVTIFETGSTEHELYSRTVPFSIKVSHVSRHWRILSLQTSSMWSTIYMGDIPPRFRLIDLYLERSGEYPLDIEIGDSFMHDHQRDYTFYINIFLDKLLPHVTRWRRLTLTVRTKRALDLFVAPLRDLRAPRLESIFMDTEQDDSGEEQDFNAFRGGASSLSSITLVGLNLRSFWPPLTGLTCFDLASTQRPISQEDFRQIVHEAPSLTDLSLHGQAVDFNEHSAPITISKLRSLKVSGFDTHRATAKCIVSSPFKALVLPALQSLEFWNASSSAMSDLVQMWGFSPASHDFPALRFLDISSSEVSDDSAVNFIKSLPTIIHVILPGKTTPRYTVVWPRSYSVLRQLSNPADNHIELWPRLQTITVPNVDSRVADILHATIRNRIVKKQPVYLTKSTLFDGELPRDAAAWLQSHVQMKQVQEC